MEGIIEVTAILNGNIKVILTSDNPIGSQILNELDGAVCHIKQNNKLDDNINVNFALVIEKDLDEQPLKKEKKSFWDFFKI